MHKQIISDEQFHCDVLPALSGVEHEDASFLTTWVGLHPRLGRVVACQGAGSDVALVTERAGEAVTVDATA